MTRVRAQVQHTAHGRAKRERLAVDRNGETCSHRGGLGCQGGIALSNPHIPIAVSINLLNRLERRNLYQVKLLIATEAVHSHLDLAVLVHSEVAERVCR